MTAKYTPGPWATEYTGCSDDSDFDIETATVVTAILQLGQSLGLEVIADVECHHASVANVEANAKLIAAAPDMAEALQMVLSCFAPEDDDVTVRKVKAALAKAGL